MKKTEFRCFGKIFIALSFMLSLNNISGQNDPNGFSSHVRFGGGIGLSFGNGFFSGSLSPSAIYQFDSSFALGLGLNGTYSSLKNHYTSTIVGGSVLALYNVIPEIQLSAEFEELNITRKYKYAEESLSDNYWYPTLFIGIGFHSNNFTVGIRYDLLFDSQRSIYADAYAPFVRVYF